MYASAVMYMLYLYDFYPVKYNNTMYMLVLLESLVKNAEQFTKRIKVFAIISSITFSSFVTFDKMCKSKSFECESHAPLYSEVCGKSICSSMQHAFSHIRMC